MSLRHKAATTAVFGYLQLAVSMATGLFIIPLTLRMIGARTWGVWLVSGELLGYAAMADLGMLGVVQWMIAEAEGRNDREEMSELVSQAACLGLAVAVIYVVASLVLWWALPSALYLSAADRRMLWGPLALTIAFTAVGYPLIAYRALLVGTQDVQFFGVLSLVNSIVSPALTVWLLLAGYGLYALVWSSALPSLLTSIVIAWRAAHIAPDVVFRLSRPRLHRLKFLFAHGVGAWLGSVGWQALAASNAILITYLGHPEWVPVYACTGKLATMGLPFTWLLPDSGHVGLAQLYGQAAMDRVRSVITMMQRAHLLIAGLAACGLLAFNPAFVTRWVGPAMFDGLALNAVLAVGLIVHSFTHGLITSASIAGSRPRVGVIVLVNGALHAALSVFLGHRFGLAGVGVAGIIATMLTQLPGSFVLLRRTTGFALAPLVNELLLPWLSRTVPLLAVAVVVGFFYRSLGVWWSAVASAAITVAYVWQLRPMYAEGLPLDPRWADWLRYFRLLPAIPELEQAGAIR
ncbi:MAG TPA: oligosaccharide flippase family protein [Vicinamibacterales bacterium]|nr:oligosaccharide flippase family protein [Vicinamibacterales bacterium]